MAIRMSLVLLAAAAGTAQVAAANNIHVCPTCAHKTIQSAVNDAVTNDLITIAAGRYVENITIEGKALTLQGSAVFGQPTEVIAAGRGPVFTLGEGVAGSPAQLIEMHNLTIAGGNHTGGTGAGGGLQVRGGAYIDLNDSVITQNYATKGGGIAIDSPGHSSTVTRCQIFNNQATGGATTGGGPGGGVFVGSGSILFINLTTITGNTATDGGGVFGDIGSALRITTADITGNTSNPYSSPFGPTGGGGGGLELAGTFGIRNSFVSRNLALGPTGGGGMYISMNAADDHTIEGTIISRNDLKTSANPDAEGIGAGVVANNTDPVQQTLILNSVYIVENQQFGGLWLEGVALSSDNTTVKDNIGGQICTTVDGVCTP